MGLAFFRGLQHHGDGLGLGLLALWSQGELSQSSRLEAITFDRASGATPDSSVDNRSFPLSTSRRGHFHHGRAGEGELFGSSIAGREGAVAMGRSSSAM